MYADTYTMTRDEFKTIHNSLYNLQYGDQPDVEREVERIRAALKGAYTQDHTMFERLSDHYQKVKETLGLQAIWSIYDVQDMLSKHPYGDVDSVSYGDHWGDSGDIVVAINGITWAALYAAADQAIRQSGDGHHVFIEGFKRRGNTLVLSTGS